MYETKSPFASKTIWAGIIQAVLAVLGFMGVDIAPGDSELVLGHVESLVISITALLTIVGRVTATTRIGG